MATGDRIIIGVVPGVLYEQADPLFTENQWGFDDGVRKYLTHPDTPTTRWPKRNQEDAIWKNMYVTDVSDREDESGMTELIVYFRGVMRFSSGEMKVRVLPAADVSMYSLPGKTPGGDKANYIATVPKPNVSREYLVLAKPTLSGVGGSISAPWLPEAPSFTLSYIPDPDEAQTLNLSPGWKMDNRSWEDIANKVFLVREDASLYYPLAG